MATGIRDEENRSYTLIPASWPENEIKRNLNSTGFSSNIYNEMATITLNIRNE